jgi:hypothetical protein
VVAAGRQEQQSWERRERGEYVGNGERGNVGRGKNRRDCSGAQRSPRQGKGNAKEGGKAGRQGREGRQAGKARQRKGREGKGREGEGSQATPSPATGLPFARKGRETQTTQPQERERESARERESERQEGSLLLRVHLAAGRAERRVLGCGGGGGGAGGGKRGGREGDFLPWRLRRLRTRTPTHHQGTVEGGGF